MFHSGKGVNRCSRARRPARATASPTHVRRLPARPLSARRACVLPRASGEVKINMADPLRGRAPRGCGAPAIYSTACRGTMETHHKHTAIPVAAGQRGSQGGQRESEPGSRYGNCGRR
ncbi:hypothetical protein NDU88_007246 [Pleurodeles waltl]|uniref:Uncharacterized protein n=1 Tax=Pleurodeles waltl TaxID=8319 RepID=A0AAV7MF81_PLEWA|nr:hypothetical protein NDU88_007246 [Pleurodeles waltl]